ADIALGDQLVQRQPIAAVAHGDLRHEPKVAGHETMDGFDVLVLLPALRQHVLLVGAQHRELADLLEVPRQVPFRGQRGNRVGYREIFSHFSPLQPADTKMRRAAMVRTLESNAEAGAWFLFKCSGP